jgi:hypothetical protein
MDAIANYEAVWLQGRYRFRLHSDAVHVKGTTFLQSDVEATVFLTGLQLRVDRLRIRSNLFWAGMWIAIVALVGDAILMAGFGLSLLDFTPALVGTIGLSGVVVLFVTAQKTEFAQFVTDAGVPALAIARSRHCGKEFETFVEKVVQQIRVCKELT